MLKQRLSDFKTWLSGKDIKQIVPAVIVIGLVTIVGSHYLLASHAAAPYLSAKAASGTLTGGATPQTDTSGNSYVQFAAACSGQAVTTSTDIQTAINNAAAGTTFCFSPGTYTTASRLTPKTGDIFDGDSQKAILDGGGILFHAFGATQSDPGSGQPELTVANVTIRGFVIQHYNPPQQTAAIESFNTDGWIIENNNISHNAEMGVATNSDVQVLDNVIDYNGREAFGAHGSNILYQGNEMAYNNNPYNPNLPGGSGGFESGAGKLYATDHATFKNNNVHDNGGNGLWADTNNIHDTFDGNTITNNWGAGIYLENNYDATVTNNIVSNNAMPSSPGGGEKTGFLYGAGIQLRCTGAISSAAPLIISGNTVTNNYNGITLIESPNTPGNTTPPPCDVGGDHIDPDTGQSVDYYVRNVLVENNTVTMSQGTTGAGEDSSTSGPDYRIFDTWNNHFVNNTYHVSSLTHPNDGYTYNWFAWKSNLYWPTWAQWQAYGNDTSGSFSSP